MNADWNTMGKSGWGICWAWDGNRDCKIPPHYEQICSVLKDPNSVALGSLEKWDFNNGRGSDYVVINLGTNDESGMQNGVPELVEGLAREQFIISSVKSFLTVIRSHNPNAKILWCWGLLKLLTVPALIQKAIEEYKAATGDKNIYTLELESIEKLEKTPEEKGSRGHPGYKTHHAAALKIVELIERLSGQAR